MDGDKELIEKINKRWCSMSYPEDWAEVIALVREHDGRRWERLHSASKNTRAWLSRNGLDGNSAYDDLAAALDAIPQSTEPPASAESLVKELEHRIDRIRHPIIYTGKYYASVEVPKLCPECDANYFISHGSKGMVCVVCLYMSQAEALEDARDALKTENARLHAELIEVTDHRATLVAENERLEKQIARFLEPKGENDGAK